MERKKEIKQRYVYSSSWLRVREDRFIHDSKEQMYNVIERNSSVVIFPISPSGRTVLVKQFRYPTQTYSLEVPMGGIEDSETMEQAAKRELLEEVNLSTTNLKRIGHFYPVPGLTDQQVGVFIAEIDEASLDNARCASNEDEIASLLIVNVQELYEKAMNGEITDGFTLSSLLLLNFHSALMAPPHAR